MLIGKTTAPPKKYNNTNKQTNKGRNKKI